MKHRRREGGHAVVRRLKVDVIGGIERCTARVGAKSIKAQCSARERLGLAMEIIDGAQQPVLPWRWLLRLAVLSGRNVDMGGGP